MICPKCPNEPEMEAMGYGDEMCPQCKHVILSDPEFTLAMELYPDRPEHHEAAAEFRRNRRKG